jgi:hypothetical protein
MARFCFALTSVAAAWILFTFAPEVYAFYPRCTFHLLTGLECPGCGVTRALHHLLHGRVERAFALNPLLFAALPVAGWTSIRPEVLKKPWFGWSCVAVLIAFWIGRNLG